MQRFIDLNPVEQSEIFDLVKKLKKQGLGYKRIIKKIGSEQGVKLHLSTLSYWFNNNVKLLGGENWFEENPSRELSYLIGVMFGDGSLSFNEKKSDYGIQLEAIDKEFVQKFSYYLSKVLKKKRNYAIAKISRGPIYYTHARSKQLYYFFKSLKEDFSKAKSFIEEYPAEFIQGLADSEGSPCISAVKKVSCQIGVAYSTNHNLLEYVKNLLNKEFTIKTALYLHKQAGITDSYIGGRPITRTKNLYSLSILSKSDMAKFQSCINFSIIRKREKLKTVLKLLEEFGPSNGLPKWQEKYVKIGKKWVLNE